MSHSTLCHDCDRLLYHAPLVAGQKARCPRCDAVVAQHKPELLNRTLCYALAGLLFYIPANFLPIMSFEILGIDSTNTMLQGVLQLLQGGFWWMAFLVLLCSVIVPLVDLTLLLLITLLLKQRRGKELTRRLLLWQHHVKEWAMLEVYMLGILVAYIKMSSMGHIVIGVGLYCFIGMLIAAILAENSFDTESAFELLEPQS